MPCVILSFPFFETMVALNTPASAEIPTTPLPTEAETRRVVRNTAAITAATMLARGLQFLWSILLARLLGESAYGTWGVIGGMITIAATLPEFGMGLIVLRDAARERARAGRYLTATLAAQPPLALIAYVGMLLAGVALNYDLTVRGLLALAGISVIVDVFGNMAHNQLLAAEKMITTSAILIAHIVVLIGLAFPILAAGGGLPGLYMATITAGVFRSGIYWIALRRAGIIPLFPLERHIVTLLFREGAPLAAASFITLVYQQVDRVLVYTRLSPAAAGNLMTAFVIVFGVVELLNTAVLTALFPLMARLSGDRLALQGITDRLAHLTLIVTLPVGVGVTVLASTLAGLLFPGFLNTSQILEVLIWYAVVMMVGNAYGQQLIIENRQRTTLFVRIGGLLLNITLNLLLLPVLGVAGAAVSILIAQSAIFAAFLWMRRDRPMSRTVFWGMLRTGAAGGIMLAGMLALRESSPILAGLVGGLLYGGGVILLRAITPADWALIRRILP
ncbi:MAG TPA: oligosaccharide flippase family protein [Aggregatilineales bacterium]|nr:oligosaccharide flippase family protein [Anaerolineales bacterium]HRE48432.1 oligosaccharide flippase family protein [Aggregatilineales bacterium]